MNSTAQEWSHIQEGRTSLGLRILIVVYRHLGAWALDFILYFVAAFYLLFNHKIRQSSKQFLCRINTLNGSPPPSLWQSFKHILNFAQAASDKITVWLGRYSATDIHLHGYETYQKYRNRGQGVFIIISHLGNADICRAISTEKKIPINILVHNDHAKNFSRLMAQTTGSIDTLNMIEVRDITPDIAVTLKNKIKAGEAVVIAGDRTPIEGRKYIEKVSFLGHNASFAQGPFILGGLLDCPVFTMFVIKKRNGYHLYMDAFATTLKMPRKDRTKQLKKHITRYVKILEDMAQRYPLQWFNFYDYWKNDE